MNNQNIQNDIITVGMIDKHIIKILLSNPDIKKILCMIIKDLSKSVIQDALLLQYGFIDEKIHESKEVCRQMLIDNKSRYFSIINRLKNIIYSTFIQSAIERTNKRTIQFLINLDLNTIQKSIYQYFYNPDNNDENIEIFMEKNNLTKSDIEYNLKIINYKLVEILNNQKTKENISYLEYFLSKYDSNTKNIIRYYLGISDGIIRSKKEVLIHFNLDESYASKLDHFKREYHTFLQTFIPPVDKDLTPIQILINDLPLRFQEQIKNFLGLNNGKSINAYQIAKKYNISKETFYETLYILEEILTTYHIKTFKNKLDPKLISSFKNRADNYGSELKLVQSRPTRTMKNNSTPKIYNISYDAQNIQLYITNILKGNIKVDNIENLDENILNVLLKHFSTRKIIQFSIDIIPLKYRQHLEYQLGLNDGIIHPVKELEILDTSYKTIKQINTMVKSIIILLLRNSYIKDQNKTNLFEAFYNYLKEENRNTFAYLLYTEKNNTSIDESQRKKELIILTHYLNEFLKDQIIIFPDCMKEYNKSNTIDDKLYRFS